MESQREDIVDIVAGLARLVKIKSACHMAIKNVLKVLAEALAVFIGAEHLWRTR
jgi:hypothetical protein